MPPAPATHLRACYGFLRPFFYDCMLSMRGGYLILGLEFCLATGPAPQVGGWRSPRRSMRPNFQVHIASDELFCSDSRSR